MPAPSRVHDLALLDALEELGSELFDGSVWRVTRAGRDPLRGSAANGRWSPTGAFEVLYTSLEQEGALAEIGYRLSLEPIWPSRMQHEVHELEVGLDRALRLVDLTALQRLGVETSRFASFDYTATQAIAAAAHFLQFDGLIAPSARHGTNNLMIFSEMSVGIRLNVVWSTRVDWSAWRVARSRGT